MRIQTDILKELRRDKGLTQEVIANHFGISNVMYSLYETGKRRMSIVGRTDDPRPPRPRSHHRNS